MRLARRALRPMRLARRALSGWSFASARRLVCEPGGLAQLGELCLPARRVFVVTDELVRGLGIVAPGVASLRASGI